VKAEAAVQVVSSTLCSLCSLWLTFFLHKFQHSALILPMMQQHTTVSPEILARSKVGRPTHFQTCSRTGATRRRQIRFAFLARQEFHQQFQNSRGKMLSAQCSMKTQCGFGSFAFAIVHDNSQSFANVRDNSRYFPPPGPPGGMPAPRSFCP
jgi:hypothetical protein